MKKAMATVLTEIGVMTVYYNGDGNPITAEKGDIIEEKELTPKSLKEAIKMIRDFWKYDGIEWIVDRRDTRPGRKEAEHVYFNL